MDWVSVSFGFIVGAIICGVVARSTGARLRQEASQADRSRLGAEMRYLDGLRRELALALLDVAPETLVEAYQSARAYYRDMLAAEPKRIAAEYKALSLKFPQFEDFDMVGLRHFVPFDAEREKTLTIVERYLDISKFLSLLAITRDEKFLFDDKEREVLDRIVGEAADRKLALRIKEAMGRYYAYRQGLGADQDASSFNDAEFSVFQMNDLTPEIRYGVVDKASGLQGVYSFYVFDDGRTRDSYYRADKSFSQTERLHRVAV